MGFRKPRTAELRRGAEKGTCGGRGRRSLNLGKNSFILKRFEAQEPLKPPCGLKILLASTLYVTLGHLSTPAG